MKTELRTPKRGRTRARTRDLANEQGTAGIGGDPAPRRRERCTGGSRSKKLEREKRKKAKIRPHLERANQLSGRQKVFRGGREGPGEPKEPAIGALGRGGRVWRGRTERETPRKKSLCRAVERQKKKRRAG